MKSIIAILFLPAIFLAQPISSTEERSLRRNPRKPYVTAYDTNVTSAPGILMGTTQALDNGHWAISTNNKLKLEIGLRAKTRFPIAGLFVIKGPGIYRYLSGDAGAPGFPVTSAKWNFEFSVNSDVGCDSNVTHSHCNRLDDYTYELALDKDPTFKTAPTKGDPINPTRRACYDNFLGTKSTKHSPTNAVNCTSNPNDYRRRVERMTVAQNSQNFGYNFFSWYKASSAVPFYPEIEGIYDISLIVKDKDKGTELDKVTIRVLACASETKDCFPTTVANCTDANIASGSEYGKFFTTIQECQDFVAQYLGGLN